MRQVLVNLFAMKKLMCLGSVTMITVLSGGTGTPKLLQGIKEIIKAGREREEYSEQALDFTAQTDYLNP